MREDLFPLFSSSVRVVVLLQLSNFPHQTGLSLTHIELENQSRIPFPFSFFSGSAHLAIPGIGDGNVIVDTNIHPILISPVIVRILDLPGQTEPSIESFLPKQHTLEDTHEIDIPGIGSGFATVHLIKIEQNVVAKQGLASYIQGR